MAEQIYRSVRREKSFGYEFKVGRWYRAYYRDLEPIKVMSRTDKTVVVNNGYSQWRMRIKHNDKGNEILIDSTVTQLDREDYTYSAGLEVEEV